MNKQELSIAIAETNRIVTIKAPVKDSLHASRFADQLNLLPYLKAFDRFYSEGFSTVKCHTIRGIYTIEKLHSDLDNMSNILNLPNETN